MGNLKRACFVRSETMLAKSCGLWKRLYYITHHITHFYFESFPAKQAVNKLLDFLMCPSSMSWHWRLISGL